MKSKKIHVSIAALTLFLAAGVASVSAYQGDYSKSGPNCTPERHEAMAAAFENKDYTSWQGLMADKGRVIQVINEGNFAKFIEAHNFGKAGNVASADEIRAELGLRTSDGQKAGAGYQGGGKNMNRGQGAGAGNRAASL